MLAGIVTTTVVCSTKDTFGKVGATGGPAMIVHTLRTYIPKYTLDKTMTLIGNVFLLCHQLIKEGVC